VNIPLWNTFLFLFVSCNPLHSDTMNRPLDNIASEDENLLLEQDNTQKIVLYQIMVRLFGNKVNEGTPWGTVEENGVGKFNDISDTALQAIADMGYTHVWYTGVIEHAVLTDYADYGIPLDDADVVKGRAGSPYAIKDYYDVAPDLASNVSERLKEYTALIQRTHNNGLKVIMDFVPNHLARGYASDAKPQGVADFGETDDTTRAFSPSNNFYYIPGEPFEVPGNYQSLGNYSFPNKDGKFNEYPARATGNDQFTARPTVDDWFETVKLNYGVDYQNNRQTFFNPVPDTWHKMEHILLYWAGKEVDGFRCDMAEMVPVAFWSWVIPRLKKQYPDLVFIAEIYNPEAYRSYIHEGGFDFLYDKVQLYDALKAIIQGHGSTDHLPGIWMHLRGINQHMLRFLENHDEQRIASPYFAGDPVKALPAMVVSALWHSGPVMVYFGQEVGEPAKGKSGFSSDDGRTTIFDYWHVPEHQKWMNNGAFDGGQLNDEQKFLHQAYVKLLKLSKEPAFGSGLFYDLHPHNRRNTTGYGEQAYAFLRFTSNQHFLVITNFSSSDTLSVNLKIPRTAMQAMRLPEEGVYIMKDVYSGSQQATFQGREVVISEGDYGIPVELEPLGSGIFAIRTVNNL
jgi:glycosidase